MPTTIALVLTVLLLLSGSKMLMGFFLGMLAVGVLAIFVAAYILGLAFEVPFLTSLKALFRTIFGSPKHRG